jgi:hypothetical protein
MNHPNNGLKVTKELRIAASAKHHTERWSKNGGLRF